jgi:hypothetical protein
MNFFTKVRNLLTGPVGQVIEEGALEAVAAKNPHEANFINAFTAAATTLESGGSEEEAVTAGGSVLAQAYGDNLLTEVGDMAAQASDPPAPAAS